MLSSFRIDSCKKCGNRLHAIRYCRDCGQPTIFECYNCHAFVDDPIHNHSQLTSQSFLQHLGVNAN